MDQFKVFLDSDVVVSAFISQTGASFEILNNSQIKKIISVTIKTEVNEVIKRLNISTPKNAFEQIKIIGLKLDKTRLVEKYLKYVFDKEDSHVVAGADKAGVKFLLTHNLKHYQTEKIKQSLGILVMRPGNYLQYLRNRNISSKQFTDLTSITS